MAANRTNRTAIPSRSTWTSECGAARQRRGRPLKTRHRLPGAGERPGRNRGPTMKRFLAAVPVILGLCAACPGLGADTPTTVELWPGKAPDEPGDLGPEKVRMSPELTKKEVEVTEPTRLVTNVSKPTLTIFRPAKDKDT